MKLRHVAAGLLASLILLPAAAHAVFPDRLIRVILPYAVGGSGDVIGRELVTGMKDELGQNVILENKPGGGTVIGSEFVAKSAPDGYTLLLIGPATHVIIPAIHPKPPYDADRDFALLSMFAVVGSMISVHPSVPVNNVKELIEYAKKNPGKLNYASAGVGTGPHLAGETFKAVTGTDIVHVPYKGAGPATSGLVAGEVEMATVNIPPQVPFIKAGRIKAIAVATTRRSSMLPDVPTVIESGLANFISESWFGLAVPSATPEDVRGTLYRGILKVGENADRRARLAAVGIELTLSTPAELQAYIRAEQQRVGPVIKKLNLKIE